jgi:para-nitrobenzyl esterase
MPGPAARALGAAFLTLLGVAPAAAQGAAVDPAHPQVRIATGVLEGFVMPSGIHAFLGIPFAAPPVGKLRWQAPQPAAAWQGVRQATQFGNRCVPMIDYPDMVFRAKPSEDCLYLNVWAPAPRPGPKLPVLVYIFGGGFRAGDGSELRYDGEQLATKGIVTVTLNYRLGVFGFLAHPELTRESPHHASGNQGLLDQAAALAWVRRNIAAFGGDPARVTIAGESAGSISVSAQMASPLSRKLIAGAIGESGAMIGSTFPPVPLAEAEQAGLRFAAQAAAAVGNQAAGDAGAPLSLARLREMPADSILAVSLRPGAGRFPMTIDGYFLTEPPTRTFAEGRQAHVPLLAGWNTEESGWRSLLRNLPPTPENFAQVVRQQFGGEADEILRLLPTTDSTQVMDAAQLLAGARFIAFGTWKWAELHARTSGKPVYRYLYARPRLNPVQPTNSPAPRGAVHSAEIEYALGNLATNKAYAWTPDDFAVSRTFEGYFANFIITGSPDGPGLPPWPANSPDSVQTMVINVESGAVPEPYRAVYQALDRFYATRATGAR